MVAGADDTWALAARGMAFAPAKALSVTSESRNEAEPSRRIVVSFP